MEVDGIKINPKPLKDISEFDNIIAHSIAKPGTKLSNIVKIIKISLENEIMYKEDDKKWVVQSTSTEINEQQLKGIIFELINQIFLEVKSEFINVTNMIDDYSDDEVCELFNLMKILKNDGNRKEVFVRYIEQTKLHAIKPNQYFTHCVPFQYKIELPPIKFNYGVPKNDKITFPLKLNDNEKDALTDFFDIIDKHFDKLKTDFKYKPTLSKLFNTTDNDINKKSKNPNKESDNDDLSDLYDLNFLFDIPRTNMIEANMIRGNLPVYPPPITMGDLYSNHPRYMMVNPKKYYKGLGSQATEKVYYAGDNDPDARDFINVGKLKELTGGETIYDTIHARVTCGICSGDFSEDKHSKHSVLECNHTFHTKCLQEYQKEEGDDSCPNCQIVIRI